MLTPNISELNQYRQADLLREAEDARRAQLAQANGQKAKAACVPLLADLGRQLIRVGKSLESEFAAPAKLGHEL